MLAISIFSISQNLFYSTAEISCVELHLLSAKAFNLKKAKHLSFGTSLSPTGLNPFPNKPWFLRVCSTNLLKTLWEKEKMLVTSNFSFSHSVFYSFGELSASFIKFKIDRSLKFVVWERVNSTF